jgi:transcriptional regulator with XRE-family HTH domain
MSLRKLKQLRLMAGMTQKVVAAKLKISQPTYQRWESGALIVPDGKRKVLAKLFEVGVDDLDEITKNFDYLGVDQSVTEDRRYYGEIAIHFIGNGPPILMPISLAERTRIFASIDSEADFFICRSLDNWTVVLRAESISDLYVSSDACDDFGPEAERYAIHLGVCPDPEFWEIVESAEAPDCLEGIPEARIKEVLAGREFDEGVFQQAIARGQASEADRDAIQADIAKQAPGMIERATMLTWQFSNGVGRKEYVGEDAELADLLMEFATLSAEDSKLVEIAVEGWHRSICINANALDYIAFPSQRIERAAMKQRSKEIDGE